MLPSELSLRSPLPSPLAMNNSPPEGPMRFVKRVFLVNARCAEASDRLPSSRKNAVTLIPNLIMENLPCYWPLTAHRTLLLPSAQRICCESTTRDQRGSDGSFLASGGPCFAEPIPEMSLELFRRSGKTIRIALLYYNLNCPASFVFVCDKNMGEAA